MRSCSRDPPPHVESPVTNVAILNTIKNSKVSIMRKEIIDLSKHINQALVFDIGNTVDPAYQGLSMTVWRGSVTVFLDQFSTAPSQELVDLLWSEILEILAPAAGPRIIHQKINVPYFLPCQLREAPLTGRTLDRAIAQGLPTTGKQRSGAHVTSARLQIFDLDSIEQYQLNEIRAALEIAGVAAACWSSHSIGKKPGVRCRLIIPIDRELKAPLYSSVHRWINDQIMFGLADRTGESLAQCQGVWAVSNDRREHAFRWVLAGDVFVLPTEALTQPARPRQVSNVEFVVADQPKFDAGQRVLFLATDTEMLKILKFTKMVIDGAGRENSVLRLAGILRSACVPEDRIVAVCTLFGNDRCTPALEDCVIQSRAERYVGQAGSEVALAMIARDLATVVVEQAVATGDWKRVDDAGDIPFQYLATYHGWVLGQLGFVGGAA